MREKTKWRKEKRNRKRCFRKEERGTGEEKEIRKEKEEREKRGEGEGERTKQEARRWKEIRKEKRRK